MKHYIFIILFLTSNLFAQNDKFERDTIDIRNENTSIETFNEDSFCSDYLDSLLKTKQLKEKERNFLISRDELYKKLDSIKCKQDFILELKARTEGIIKLIENIQLSLIHETKEFHNKNGLSQDIEWNYDVPMKELLENGKGEILKEQITKYQDYIKHIDQGIDAMLITYINLDDRENEEGIKENWQTYFFNYLPLKSTLILLLNYKNEIYGIESLILKSIK